MEYVCGFLFDGGSVFLINKNKPEWQSGKLNGIGGKTEPGETPYCAMVREFKEETGADIFHWRKFCTVLFEEGIVHFFTAVLDTDQHPRPRTTTDEKVAKFITSRIHYNKRVIPNLKWLIPMAKEFSENFSGKPLTIIQT
jgi:8-oxo-dGTP diphosphatase